MNMYKKILLISTIVMFMLCLGGVAYAEGDFLMRIDTVTVPQGFDGEVIVPVYIDSMPEGTELSCFAWEFYFDSEKLNFITSKDPADFAGELITSTDDCTIGKVERIDGTQGKFRFGWTSTSNYITETGEALHLKFYVHSAMEPGVYNIVADPFSDIRSGTESIIYTDDLYVDINSYLIFGGIVIEGEEPSEYNDYDLVSSKAKYPSFIPEGDSVASGIVDEIDGVPVDKESITVTPGTDSDNNSASSGTSSGSSSSSGSSGSSGSSIAQGNSSGSGTLVSSEYRPQHTNDYTNDVQTIADSFDAGTMIAFTDSHIVFDTIKAQSGWLVCALYKGEKLVGYDISWATAGEKMSANIVYSDIPDMAVSVIMRGDGTFDCYGKYPIYTEK